ncbi:MAG: hypothetical protein ACJAX5_001561, partial [Patiriisocius sp.]
MSPNNHSDAEWANLKLTWIKGKQNKFDVTTNIF